MAQRGYLDRTNTEDDRRSSVRVRSLLPCRFRIIDESEVEEIESRILDLAVVESDDAFDNNSRWDERSDELPREAALMLNEVRALRRKVTELQRTVEKRGDDGMASRWITINDRGFWFERNEDEGDYQEGHLVEIQLELPNIHTRRILAIGEVIRIDTPEDRSDSRPGVAVEFQSLAQVHQEAIMRYALLRERQVARSDGFSSG